MQYAEIAARALFAVVFTVAVAGKVSSRSNWTDYVASLRTMRVVRGSWTREAAIATVLAETAITVLALVPVRAAGTSAFVLAAGLLGVLTVAVAVVVRRGTTVRCRCLGASGTPLGMHHVARNAALVAAALLGLAGSLSTGGFQAPMVAAAAFAGLFIGLLATRWDDLATLVRSTA
jgi:Methylamine utilisation protein MauE